MEKRKRKAGLKAASFKRSDCPVACTLDVIGDRWSLLIVRDLLFGRTRYSELQNADEGIPTNILAQRLKHLEQAGIVERLPSSRPRSRYEYRLTETGQKLAPTLKALAEWGRSEIKDTRALPRRARSRK